MGPLCGLRLGQNASLALNNNSTDRNTSYVYDLWLLLSDYREMAKWFGAHYNQEVRFSSVVKGKEGPNINILLHWYELLTEFSIETGIR